jgi:CheY-like chemotaxis protein
MTIKILVVDDSKLARIVVGKAISAVRPEWQRIEAGSADEASLILGREHIDLAILDFNMPGRNGLELGGEIRRDFPGMPIALATANVQDEIVAQARAINATFISKPITEDGIRGFLSGAALKLLHSE